MTTNQFPTSTSAVLPHLNARAVGMAARAAIVAAALVGLLTLWMVLRPASPPADLRVQPIRPADVTVINPATVAVALVITNHGVSEVTPTCDVTAGNADGSHHGTGQFHLADPIGPGHSTRFTAELVISGLGALAITQASAHCS
jgi:hypothetical protein